MFADPERRKERREQEYQAISLHMEFGSERSSHGGDGAKVEKRSESSFGDDEGRPKQGTAIEVKINSLLISNQVI